MRWKRFFSALRPHSSMPRMYERYKQLQEGYPFPDYLLLMQVGDFYEFLGKEAVEEACRLLNISCNRAGDKTGFPVRSLPNFLGRLLRAGRCVIIADQVASQQKSTKTIDNDTEEDTHMEGEGTSYKPLSLTSPLVTPIFDRHIARIVTPGTVLQEDLLDPKRNNHLVAIKETPLDRINGAIGSISMAWVDVSTGKSGVATFPEDSHKHATSLLQRLDPSELLIISENSQNAVKSPLQLELEGMSCRKKQLFVPAKYAALTDTNENLSAGEQETMTAIQEYLGQTLFAKSDFLEGVLSIQPPERLTQDARMTLERSTLEALHILDGPKEENCDASDSFKRDRTSSLLQVLDYTKTAIGARLLRERLSIKTCHELIGYTMFVFIFLRRL